MTPRSCMMPKPVSASELEKDTLNLRPISWQTGFLKKNRHNASAQGRTLKGSSGSSPRSGRGGDVAHGVATSFAQGHLALFKLRPQLGTVLEFDMVNLNVLPGGQMVFAGGVFVADVEDGPELVKRQQSHGDLDSDHLNARLPLAVDAARKAEASKPFFIHATFFVEEDAPVEVEDVLLDDGVVDFVDETEHEDGDCRVKKKGLRSGRPLSSLTLKFKS